MSMIIEDIKNPKYCNTLYYTKKSQIKQQLYHNNYKVRPKPPQHAIVVLDRTRKCHKLAVRMIGAFRERQPLSHAHGCKTFKSGSGYLLMLSNITNLSNPYNFDMTSKTTLL